MCRDTRLTVVAMVALIATTWMQTGECRPYPRSRLPVPPATGALTAELEGCSWVEQSPAWLEPWLLCVDPVDENVVWVGGSVAPDSVIVLRTTDGGASWASVGPHWPLNDPFAIAALDAETCVIGQVNGYVQRTTDGGDSWTVVATVSSFINGIHFFDSQRGWLHADPLQFAEFVIDTGPHAGTYRALEGLFTTPISSLPGGVMSGPTVYVGRACEGGEVPPAPGPGVIALVICEVGEPCRFDERATNVINAGYAGMVVSHHEQGGENLIQMTGDPRDIPAVFVSHATGLTIAGVDSLPQLTLGDPGEEITASSLGRLFNLWVTSDGGATWTEAPNRPETPGPDMFGCIYAYDWAGDQVGIFGTYIEPLGVATTGTIFRTADGGEHWYPIDIDGIDFIWVALDSSSGYGLLVGGDVSGGTVPAIRRSTDFGESWEVLDTFYPAYHPIDQFWTVVHIEGTSQFFVHAKNSDPPMFGLQRTTDNGETWNPCTPPGDFNYLNVRFLDPIEHFPLVDHVGWAVGSTYPYANPGRIFKLHEVVGIEHVPVPAPTRMALRASPNPFNPWTTLAFELPAAGRAVVAVYDGSGRLLRTLGDARFESGAHMLTWDGRDEIGSPVASGVYLAQLRAGGGSLTRKLVLIR